MGKYLFLGFMQGLTEFLPVSSSGHLVLLQHILDMKEQPLFDIVVLHLATTLALTVFFFGEIIKAVKNPRLILHILVVTIVTGIIAIAGKDYFTGLFSSIRMVTLSLFITGIILLSTKKFIKFDRNMQAINLKDALVLGLAQAIAVIPGISRSGITISTLLFRRIDRDSAFRFSFLAAIPAITGAFILEVKDLNSGIGLMKSGLVFGFISAFISGLFSLYLLKYILKKAKFFYFGYYCILLSIFSWIFLR